MSPKIQILALHVGATALVGLISPKQVTLYTNCFSGDFNGDGLSDIACFTANSGDWSMGLSTGTSWQTEVWSGGSGPASPASNQCLSADFNGDRKAALACYTGGSGSWNIVLSSGTGWQSQFWNGGPLPGGPQPSIAGCVAGDFNGDSLADLDCSGQIALSAANAW